MGDRGVDDPVAFVTKVELADDTGTFIQEDRMSTDGVRHGPQPVTYETTAFLASKGAGLGGTGQALTSEWLASGRRWGEPQHRWKPAAWLEFAGAGPLERKSLRRPRTQDRPLALGVEALLEDSDECGTSQTGCRP
jgi:hypothetical protein